MNKNTQTIACCILIPMLVFSFAVTVRSENLPLQDDSKNVIYQYFNYRNKKDIESIKNLLLNKEDINIMQSDNDYIKSIKLINVEEEQNESIKKAYLKNSTSIADKNTKIYKVKYEVIYDSKSTLSNKSGIYDCWYFLTRFSYQSSWKIDIGAV